MDFSSFLKGFQLSILSQTLECAFNVIFCYTGCFQKVDFQELNLCTYINFELSSAFLYTLCELLEK